MAVTTKSIDRGESFIRREIAKMKRRPLVKIGVIGTEEKIGPDGKVVPGLTVADVAIWNEFGTADGRVPERSFLRSTADAKASEINALTDKLIENITTQQLTTETALKLIGMKMQAEVQNTIAEFTTPPNAPSTLRAKARRGGVQAVGKGPASATYEGLHPLVDTGQLAAAIRYEVSPNGEEAITDG